MEKRKKLTAQFPEVVFLGLDNKRHLWERRVGNLKTENVKINRRYGKTEGKRDIPSEKEQILRMINFQ